MLSAPLAYAVEGETTATVSRGRLLAVLLASPALAAASLYGALRPARVRRVRITTPNWPKALDGFRIVQLSDLHLGPILGAGFARRVVARCNRLRPDLIAITGDLVDGPVARVAPDTAPLARLKATHGAFFVTGNHDHYAGADAWCEQVRDLGITPLRNERRTIGRNGTAFELAGMDDTDGSWQTDRAALSRTLEGRERNLPLVLLAHDPEVFRAAAAAGVALQLSGHTHGGQIWPLCHVVRLSTTFVAGLFRQGDAHLYVSRGTGFWGPPMRLFAPSEITLIEVRAA